MELAEPTLTRELLDGIHRFQRLIGRVKRSPGAGMRTDLRCGDRPVIFVHNPRSGGRSLETFFNVKRLSHSSPVEKLSERHWLANFVVTSVRHPLDRFFSSYFGEIKSPDRNRLVKMYGWGVKQITPLEFLELVRKHPRHAGPQTQWTDFPSLTKPRADLVLKLEEAANWESQLKDAGIDIGDRRIPHRGKTENTKIGRAEKLGLSDSEMTEIRVAVEDFFRNDYIEFGYQFESGQSAEVAP